ncbi:MAG: PQQ-binding-like beta-propeller repeat protein [Verrucomicrobiia bacterium]|jgi:outer membrane protein assembly factor BamB
MTPKIPRAILLLFAFLFASPAFAQQQFDWPQWRGPNRNGVSTETNWVADWGKKPLKVVWRANVGDGYSSMSTSANRVYTMGNFRDSDTVFCLNDKNGKVLWRYNYPCAAADLENFRGPRCTPTVDGNRVYTVSRLGHLLCLNANNGTLLWTKNLINDYNGRHNYFGLSGSPLVIGNTLIVETGSAKWSVVGLNKATGRFLWGNGNNMAGYSSPVPMQFGREPGVVVLSAQTVTGRVASNGRVVFRRSWTTQDGNNVATPLVWQDKVFVSSGYKVGCALLQVGEGVARPVWSNRNMRNHFSSSVLIGGHIYGFDESELRCMDLITGTIKWRTRVYLKGSLMGAGDRLIVQSETGTLAVVEASPWKFTEISKSKIFNARRTWTVPVLSNGRIYTRNRASLICLQLEQSSE